MHETVHRKLSLFNLSTDFDFFLLQVFVTSPYEFPDPLVNHHFYRQSNGMKGSAYFIQLFTVASSPSLRRLSVRQRNCLFPEEVKLYTSAVYTRGACNLNCNYKETIGKCQCCPQTLYNFSTYSK